MKNKFGTECKSMEEVFVSNSVYEIPVNQRRYSWKKNQFEEYFNDIKSIMFKENNHYLGVITLIEKTDEKDNITRYEVIDGQQRLITTILYITALRDFRLCVSKNEEDLEEAREIQKQYIRVKKLGKTLNKLNSSTIDKETFKSLVNVELNDIEHEIDKDSIGRNYELDKSEFINKNMKECYNYFFSKFKKMYQECEKYKMDISDERLSEEELKKLLIYKFEGVLSKIEIITVVSDNVENIFLYFDSLNNRGLQLNQMDIIRNKFFQVIKKKFDDNFDYFGKEWDEIVAILDEYDCVKFLKYFYICEKETIVQSKNMPEKYLQFFEGIENEIEMKKTILKLKRYARTFKNLHKAKEFSEKENNIINNINELGQRACFSFLMDYFEFERNIYKRVEILENIEKMCFRRVICESSPKQLDGIFRGMIKTKKNNCYDNDEIISIIKENLPSDKNTIHKINERKWENDIISLYTLEILKNGKVEKIDRSDNSIEELNINSFANIAKLSGNDEVENCISKVLNKTEIEVLLSV